MQEIRKNRGEDLVSVISFSSTAKSWVVKSKWMDLDFETIQWGSCSGGTNFHEAMKETKSVLDLTPSGFTQTVFFLTDGIVSESNLSLTINVLKNMRLACPLAFYFFTIGVLDYDKNMLERVTKAANGGNLTFVLQNNPSKLLHTCDNLDSLQQAFTDILSAQDNVEREITHKINFISKCADQFSQDMDAYEMDYNERYHGRLRRLQEEKTQLTKALDDEKKNAQDLFKEFTNSMEIELRTLLKHKSTLKDCIHEKKIAIEVAEKLITTSNSLIITIKKNIEQKEKEITQLRKINEITGEGEQKKLLKMITNATIAAGGLNINTAVKTLQSLQEFDNVQNGKLVIEKAIYFQIERLADSVEFLREQIVSPDVDRLILGTSRRELFLQYAKVYMHIPLTGNMTENLDLLLCHALISEHSIYRRDHIKILKRVMKIETFFKPPPSDEDRIDDLKAELKRLIPCAKLDKLNISIREFRRQKRNILRVIKRMPDSDDDDSTDDESMDDDISDSDSGDGLSKKPNLINKKKQNPPDNKKEPHPTDGLPRRYRGKSKDECMDLWEEQFDDDQLDNLKLKLRKQKRKLKNKVDLLWGAYNQAHKLYWEKMESIIQACSQEWLDINLSHVQDIIIKPAKSIHKILTKQNKEFFRALKFDQSDSINHGGSRYTTKINQERKQRRQQLQFLHA